MNTKISKRFVFLFCFCKQIVNKLMNGTTGLAHTNLSDFLVMLINNAEALNLFIDFQ